MSCTRLNAHILGIGLRESEIEVEEEEFVEIGRQLSHTGQLQAPALNQVEQKTSIENVALLGDNLLELAQLIV